MTALRILVVSHLSPPLGGMTPLHVSRLVGLLADQGHEVDLLTIRAWEEHPVYFQDRGSPELRGARVVTRTFAGPVHAAAAISRRFRKSKSSSKRDGLSPKLRWTYRHLGKQLLVPDPSVDWAPFALWAAAGMERARAYDLIISVAHPVTSHLVAWALSRRLGTKWIGYYLDPWSFNPDNLTLPRWRQFIDRVIEGLMVRDMDLMLVNTDETRVGYLKNFASLDEAKVRVCGIGYEPEDYRKASAGASGTEFRLVYTGIFTRQRNPAPLFTALDGLPREIDLSLTIAGTIDQSSDPGQENAQIARVRYAGRLSHAKTVELQRSATLLVLIGWPGGYQIPAKLYEYIGARRPILAIRGDDADPSAEIVERLHRGMVVDPDADAIRSALCRMYEMHRNLLLDESFDLAERPEYTWTHQLAPIKQAVDDVTAV